MGTDNVIPSQLLAQTPAVVAFDHSHNLMHLQEMMPDTSSEGISTAEEQNDSDSAALMKKRRLENGVYTCDLCSKVFQKGSSLLRHKYEHTGKMVSCNETSHSCQFNTNIVLVWSYLRIVKPVVQVAF